jgi:hypothetical protein
MAKATSILTDEIMKQAKAFSDARSEFDENFMDFRRGVPPMQPEHFWPVVVQFREVLLDTMTHRKEGYVEAAANEFMRLAAVKDGDIASAVHFALSWSHYKHKAYAACEKAPFSFDRGDDSFSDLMDALPLMGQMLNRKVCLGRIESLAEFNEIVAATCDGAGRVLEEVVLRGENYFAMSLEDAAQKWVVLEAKRS